MKHLKSRKLFAVVLAVVLVLSMSVTAFAAWPSFQNTNSNNGVIAAQPPITNPTLVSGSPISLPYYNPNGDVYSGVDATSVIDDNDIAYTLYNGGVTQGFSGGARMQATNLSSGATVWNKPIDLGATNSNQLSASYLLGSTIYTAVNINTPIWGTSSVAGWSASGTAGPATGGHIVGDTATFSSGSTGSISTTINIDDPVSYIYLPTNLIAASSTDTGTYTIELGGTTLIEDAPLTSYGTYDNYNGTSLISAGSHTLTVTVTNNTSNVTVNRINLSRYDWRVYAVNSANGNATMVIGDSQINPDYEGQVITPISADGTSGNELLYFGTYGGTRSYYQYNPRNATSSTNPARFAANDDFYGAGAVVVTDPTAVNKTVPYVIFGSESGTIYIRERTSFASSTGRTLSVTSGDKIRSTMAYDSTSQAIYFTSYNSAAATGTLWKMPAGGISASLPTLSSVALPGSSTSTPVISNNEYIYTGWFGYDSVNFYSIGGVIGVQTSNFTTGGRFDVYGNGVNGTVGTQGDPVQSSPIVYTDDEVTFDDFIYFTTNADHSYDIPPVTNHNGYCYSYTPGSSAGSFVWNPATGGTYALQGFASNNGYLIYGDDSNSLYIFH